MEDFFYFYAVLNLFRFRVFNTIFYMLHTYGLYAHVE